ncbi:hypothetical protein [Nitrosomonas marina]|uniref:Uncharacterized protein n=1 Tax=Nitrosomonas marina TaxID=917 RepID=A0A1H8DSB4_9PROT|nr:hypothetical protein [Nitrosomonas marina]SEN09448.1 hypothetical protein SAMN05216325_107138 [Nitrosomonas marina]
MNDEQRRIIIRRISSYEQQGEDARGRAPVPPINRWVALALLIPVLALLAVLGVFFFTIFVALFSIIAVVIGVRIWWLRKKYRRSAHQQTNASQAEWSSDSEQSTKSGIVEDAEIIEETTVVNERKQSKR